LQIILVANKSGCSGYGLDLALSKPGWLVCKLVERRKQKHGVNQQKIFLTFKRARGLVDGGHQGRI